MATSRIPAVWKAVHDALVTALAAETTVKVKYGEPRPQQVSRETVYVGPVENWSQSWPHLTGNARQEEFNLQISVLVANATAETFQTAVERAFVLLGTIETTLRSDADFGVPGVKFSDPIHDGSVQPFWTDDGTAVLLTVAVGVTARI